MEEHLRRKKINSYYSKSMVCCKIKFAGKAVRRFSAQLNVLRLSGKKNLSACKPDPVGSLPYFDKLSKTINLVIIYLAATLLLQSCCLPFGIERAALRRRYMWHYSTQGLPNLSITAKTRELLPHVFNLTPLLSYSPD